MMKKLITVISLWGVLSGCAADNKKPIDDNLLIPNTPKLADMYYYECDDKAMVSAKYDNDTETAIIHVNAPSWQLYNQEITLSQAVSASGSRYVNDSNPASVYEWFAKEGEGLLSVVIAGSEHMLVCQEKQTSDKP